MMPIVLNFLALMSLTTASAISLTNCGTTNDQAVLSPASGIGANAMCTVCVSLATGLTVLTASGFGLPVSTTHVAVGGVFGVGFAREWLDRRRARQRSDEAALPEEEVRRRRLIRRSHVATIMAAWMITLPTTAALGAAASWLILRLAG